MDRRQFFASGVGAAAVAAGSATEAQQGRRRQPQRPAARRPVAMKVGCQSGPSTDEHFAYFARYGLRNVCASPERPTGGRLHPTVEELSRLKERANRHGLSLDILTPPLLPSSHTDREANYGVMRAESPRRDREIEAFQMTLRNAAAVGIPCVKYNMSILGVLRTERTPGRGDSTYSTWRLREARPATPLTRAGPVNADRFWERIQYFLDRVVPVANETRVRIACHQHDPGVPVPQGYQGVDRVLGTVDGVKRFVQYRDSPYHGLNMCIGTFGEMMQDPNREIHDAVRWFGARRKIFNIHFRNIRGRRDDFQEVFPDEGSMNFVEVLRTLHEVGYDGMLMPDHVPHAEADTDELQSFAYCYGYIKGLLQSLEHAA